MEPTGPTRDLHALAFDNRFVRELSADTDETNVPRQVSGAHYSWVAPTAVSAPRLVAYSPELAEELGLSHAALESPDFVEVFSGNRQLAGMETWACRYGGHQFGRWAGQLGDGRAINLGEVVDDGDRWTLQLKGAGPTPYSRTADGLAVLRSSVREFLCSEAMHHLGVPTTRALCLLRTGDEVLRDMFYDGNPRYEPGAIVCRVARSFTRFGNFEILAARGEHDLLRHLADYTIRTDFPELGEPSRDVYVEWFEEICRRTAAMIVEWERVGFVHGVMNTDNMSILGLTIDYGPYGWLEDYDPNWTPNTTDAGGRRYRFGAQAHIAHWNLGQLGRALLPLMGDDPQPLQEALDRYPRAYEEGWRAMMAAKLGLSSLRPEDEAFTTELFAILRAVETDLTIFFRRLSRVVCDDCELPAAELGAPLTPAYYQPDQLDAAYEARLAAWLSEYRERLSREGARDAERRRGMDAVNPKYVPRNYLAQMAIEKAEAGDDSMIGELLDVLRRPYDEQPEQEELAARRPEWARHRPGCSMLSCSS